jgi:DNA-binding LacI/PurR family transcriptional regulator
VSKTNNQGAPKRITLKFLAERLNLSKTTISFVLNNAPSLAASTISAATRERVWEAARHYNYKPNYFARYLNSKRSYLIGVLTPDMAEGYSSEIICGIEEELLPSSYNFFVASHQWSEQRLKDTANFFVERGVEGFILINTRLDAQFNIPIVGIGQHQKLPNRIAIEIDNLEGIRLALSHLVSLGHRKIAFFKGHKGSADTELRWSGVQRAARQLNVPIDPRLVVSLERIGMQQVTAIQEGESAANKLLSRKVEFTALLAFNDMSAIGASHSLRKAGLRLPQDCSIIGFDDVPAARIAYPRLTSVGQPLREMGRRAVRTLIDVTSGKETEDRFVMRPKLIVRDSTAAPALRNAAMKAIG